jgi:hypothetical protein
MNTDQPSSKKKPGEVVLEAMGYHKGPETLDRDLNRYWRAFQQAPYNDVANYYAFTSIAMIMAAWSKHSKSLPDVKPPCLNSPLTSVRGFFLNFGGRWGASATEDFGASFQKIDVIRPAIHLSGLFQ